MSEIKLSSKTEEYVDAIKHELETLEETRFTGNRTFQLNFKEGSVANLNVGSHKSIKL